MGLCKLQKTIKLDLRENLRAQLIIAITKSLGCKKFNDFNRSNIFLIEIMNQDKREQELKANWTKKTEKQKYILNKIQFWLIIVLALVMSSFLIPYIFIESNDYFNYESRYFTDSLKFLFPAVVGMYGLWTSIRKYKDKEQEDR